MSSQEGVVKTKSLAPKARSPPKAAFRVTKHGLGLLGLGFRVGLGSVRPACHKVAVPGISEKIALMGGGYLFASLATLTKGI